MIAVVYVAALVVANLAVAHFGPGASPFIAFLLIGMDLTLRDRLHEQWRGKHLAARLGLLIVAAGAVSYLLNPASGRIAVASVVAFVVAAAVDSIVYQALIRRPFLQRSNASNAAGAVADSLIFPTIAFGAFLPLIVVLQIAAKVAGGWIWSLILRRSVEKPAT
jgi:uncharacterized PurR-regulated membrane protein YhhQ (DUF165 family)